MFSLFIFYELRLTYLHLPLLHFLNVFAAKENENFRDSLKDLESEQRRLAKEIGRDREERER